MEQDISFLEEIKEKLKPKENKIVDEVLKTIEKNIKFQALQVEYKVGGSYAKGTSLKGDFDVDIFLRFDKSYENKELPNYSALILKDFKYKRVHGSRDYFQFKKDKINFEIVPVYKINKISEAINITDCSPLHVEFMAKKIKKKQKDEIRLAKQFCKAGRVYGAESYIKGFSGHVLDILILHYGSFLELVKNAKNWKPKVIIDIENHKKNPLKELNKAKLISPLILIDPIQPERNAAAALSLKKFNQFKELCENFLKKPSKSFFVIRKLCYTKFKNKNKSYNEFCKIIIKPVKLSKDVAGSKIMKIVEFIKRNLNNENFDYEIEWEFNKKGIILIATNLKGNYKEIQGPPLKAKNDCKKFIEKRCETYEKNNRLYAKEKIQYKNSKELFKKLIKDKYIKERIEKIESINF